MSEVTEYRQRIKWVRTVTGTRGGIEIGKLPHGDYAIRNSAFRANTVVVTEQELAEFFHSIHAGVFNDVIEVIR